MALIALLICLITLLLHLIRLIGPGKPKDFSRPAGTTARGIFFAFTGAMSPTRKESAYLHLPTYTAGLFYHMGTFLSLSLFFFILAGKYPQGVWSMAFIAFLTLSATSGTAILVRRIVRKKLRSLSNPDDFISNILVTLFHFLTLAVLLSTVLQSCSLKVLQSSSPDVQLPNCPTVQLIYYLSYTTLMLYLPVGKLRHTVYFFAARYHLGYFYGRRGVWPPSGFSIRKNQKVKDIK